jgi:hypothetical protein
VSRQILQKLDRLSVAGTSVHDIRRRLRALRWRSDYGRLEQIQGIGEGRRAFLVGSGPSLGSMDLARLDGEFVCVVNMGIRAVGTVVSHADMHVVTDTNRYRRFAEEIEAIALEHLIPYRFVSHRVRRLWRSLPRRANEPFYLVPHVDKLTERPDLPPVAEGIIRAPSVLVTGAVLLDFLGFSPIYVIGCDLDYDSQNKYFYELGTLDVVHENDPKVISRRTGTESVNGYFAILRDALARKGRSIVNAGVGGNLTSLPRADFDGLFDGREQGAPDPHFRARA